MPSFLLILLWLLTFALGRIRSSASWNYSHFIPGMLFFRISLTAAILGRLLVEVSFNRDVIGWIGLVAEVSLYFGLVELVLDIFWLVAKSVSPDHSEPARIIKNIAFFVSAVVIVAAELNSRGILTTLGSAAILGGLAFILGPGSASQISNISSALSVQVERQFSVGDWVEINNHKGLVTNISWNSTYLHDDIDDCYVIIPNSLIDTGTIVNYSRPSRHSFRLEVAVGLPLDMPPGKALQLLEGVLASNSKVLDAPKSKVFIRSFGEYSINYFLKFSIASFRERTTVQKQVFAGIWYGLNRSGYRLPYPLHDLHTSSMKEKSLRLQDDFIRNQSFCLLRAVDLFQSLSDIEIRGIVKHDRILSFFQGELVFGAGDPGHSMYVILEGECSILLPNSDVLSSPREIARLQKGMIFGEIAALTNADRTASVQAMSHLVLQEISQEQIKSVFLSNQDAMNAFARVMATREAEHRSFTPEQQQCFESGLMERMISTFGKLFSI